MDFALFGAGYIVGLAMALLIFAFMKGTSLGRPRCKLPPQQTSPLFDGSALVDTEKNIEDMERLVSKLRLARMDELVARYGNPGCMPSNIQTLYDNLHDEQIEYEARYENAS
jgi:hypothetical protein